MFKEDEKVWCKYCGFRGETNNVFYEGKRVDCYCQRCGNLIRIMKRKKRTNLR